MKNIKKFLTIILAISLLFAISCGDRPTGSTPIQSQGTLTIGSESYTAECYDANDSESDFNNASYIKIDGIRFNRN